tara:strand:- start:310 stop:756 length:447 start_codon:yes stop_codon:yes gene_type:complete
MFPIVSGVAMGQGPPALAISLSVSSTTIEISMGGLDPEQAHVIDTSAGDADSTASASGGDGSYSYAWTVAEDGGSDPGNQCAVLAAGTQNAAQYNDITWRITQAEIIAGGRPTGVEPFQNAVYDLVCTVTDGASATASATYIVTIAGA